MKSFYFDIKLSDSFPRVSKKNLKGQNNQDYSTINNILFDEYISDVFKFNIIFKKFFYHDDLIIITVKM